MDPRILAKVVGVTEKQIKKTLLAIIHQNADKVSKGNLFVERALLRLAVDDVENDLLDTYDGSLLLKPILKSFKISQSKFSKEYILHCEDKGILNTILPQRLVGLFERSPA